jgi:hypothetical protein
MHTTTYDKYVFICCEQCAAVVEKPAWMKVWSEKWYQHRQQWWADSYALRTHTTAALSTAPTALASVQVGCAT